MTPNPRIYGSKPWRVAMVHGGPGSVASWLRETWLEAAELRNSGRLLGTADRIECPVLAIRGYFDRR